MPFERLFSWISAIVGLCGLAVFALGLSAFIGHVSSRESLYFWLVVAMAPNTSIGFVLTGIALMAIGKWMHERE